MKYPRRSKRIMKRHGRSGHPIIHRAKSGRTYVLVRAKKGKGVKRLYNYQKYMR